MFGYAWYRDFAYKMATHAHVFSLSSKEQYSENVLLYLVSAMSYLKKKYNYNEMCNWTKMKNEKLYLPISACDQLNIALMENYIQAIKKLVIADLIEWKDLQINTYKKLLILKQ